MYMLSMFAAIIFVFCFSKVIWDVISEVITAPENKESYNTTLTRCLKKDKWFFISTVLSAIVCVATLFLMAYLEHKTLIEFILTNEGMA